MNVLREMAEGFANNRFKECDHDATYYEDDMITTTADGYEMGYNQALVIGKRRMLNEVVEYLKDCPYAGASKQGLEKLIKEMEETI